MKITQPESDASMVRCGRVWVVPNRNCLGLVALLAAMGYAGASQTNAAAYLLGFSLAGLAAVSLAHAWANVRGVQLTVDPIRPAFAGEYLRLRLGVSVDSPRPRYGLRIASPGSAPAILERVTEHPSVSVDIEVPAKRRGRFETVVVKISSLYPMGFFSTFRRCELHAPHFVYPRPEGHTPLPQAAVALQESGTGPRIEGDDFAGVRSYQPGESQRHIDWKAVARGQPLLTKQWAGEASETLVLDWESTPGDDHEARLSQLARWIIQVEREQTAYGLRLPGVKIAPANGDRHFHICLRALATFTSTDRSA